MFAKFKWVRHFQRMAGTFDWGWVETWAWLRWQIFSWLFLSQHFRLLLYRTFYFHSKFAGSISIRNFDIPETWRKWRRRFESQLVSGCKALVQRAEAEPHLLVPHCKLIVEARDENRTCVNIWLKNIGKVKDEIVTVTVDVFFVAYHRHWPYLFCMLCMWLVHQAVRSFIEAWDVCGWGIFIGKPWAKFGMAKREVLVQCHNDSWGCGSMINFVWF